MLLYGLMILDDSVYRLLYFKMFYVNKVLNSIHRKCSHAHLVQLLQDSGTAPILEVLRCEQDECKIIL